MDGSPHRWWHASGPWLVRLETAPAGWRPAWGALLAGGEPTMPLGDDVGRTAPAPPGAFRQRRFMAATVEGALAWARGALEGAAGRPDHPGASVAFRCRGDTHVRWRARSVADVRAAAREVAGWVGDASPGDATPPGDPPPPAGAAPRDGLTDAQRAVVEHDGGRAVVLAVAGAGKTTTMVARVRARVARGRCDPTATLVVSFSRAAVAAMRARLDAAPETAGVDVRTFHALAHRLLRARAQLGGAPPPPRGPPPEQVVATLANLARRAATQRDPDLAAAWRDVDLAAFSAYRGRALARLELPGLDRRPLPTAARAQTRPPPPDRDHPAHPSLLEDLERERLARGWVDHDQLLVEAWAAVHEDAALQAWARHRWRTWVVDEAQDLNAVQLALLERLTEGRDDVVLVGDDDQAIYGFRGSAPGLLRGYAARHGARVLVLDAAFRSRAEPLAVASALMAAVDPEPAGAATARPVGSLGQRPRAVGAARGSGPCLAVAVRPVAVRGTGGTLTLDEVEGAEAEARALLDRAGAHHAAGRGWSAQAVLLRRFDQAPVLERAAARAGVPLRLEGVPPLPRHPEVVAAWAGVALALGHLEDASAAVRERAWRRWLAGPGGLDRAAAWSMARALAPDPTSGAAAWRHGAPRGAAPELGTRLEAVATAAHAHEALRLAGTDPRTWPAGPGLRLAATIDLLADAPTPPAAALAAWRHGLRAPPPTPALLVTSVHRAKGLEWTVVHVPGMAAGVFPTCDDPEERRLAYVAWTRARDALHLYRDRSVPASPFLADGAVRDVVALATDLAHLRAGRGSGSLAAAWARREAGARFGTAVGVTEVDPAPAPSAPTPPGALAAAPDAVPVPRPAPPPAGATGPPR